MIIKIISGEIIIMQIQMDRYSQIPVRKTLEGKRYFATNRYPDIPLSSNDLYIITTIGDRYDTLASQYYKNSSYWWIISIANNKLKQDSLTPPVGAQIRIPQNISSILATYESLNQFPTDNNVTSVSSNSY
jgi:hypothetical protein